MTFDYGKQLHIMMLAPWPTPHSERPMIWLHNAGHKITYCADQEPTPSLPEGVDFVRIPHFPRGIGAVERCFGAQIAHHYHFYLKALAMRAIWKRLQPDIVHVHWIDEQAYICARAGIHPLVLSAWGSDINRLSERAITFRDDIAYALAHSSAILVEANDLGDRCCSLAGGSVNIQYLPLGIDAQRFRPLAKDAAQAWRTELGIPAAAAVLLSIRGWGTLYRHAEIFEAFAQAYPHFNREAFLIFKQFVRGYKGADGLTETLQTRVEECVLSHAVRWLPEVPDEHMPLLFTLADVVINYPRMDSFPVAFHEAAACECPVITADLPAYRGTFAETFFTFVDPIDLTSLTQGMIQAVNTPASRDTLAAARRKIMDEYTEAATLDRMVAIYRQVAAGGIS